MGRKKQNEAPATAPVPVVPTPDVVLAPDVVPAPDVARSVGAVPAPQDAPIAQEGFSKREDKLRDPASPIFLVGATAVAEAMDNASASAPTRLDAAEALLEYTDRLPPQCADYAQRALDFLLRVVDRKRPDAINAEPRDRVRAARLILKYGQG